MKVKPKYFDFAGWVSKNDVRCTDGTIIRGGAFSHHDGRKVPLIWNHQHNSPEMIIGHAILENRPAGTYAYGFLNDTENGQIARNIIEHGDIDAMSIYANHVKSTARGDILHGEIQEVSLVLAGADKTALIEHVVEHDDGAGSSGFVFYNGPEETDFIYHSDEYDEDEDYEEDDEEEYEDDDDDDLTVSEVFDTLDDVQKEAVFAVIGAALNEDSDEEDDMANKRFSHSDGDVADVLDTLDEEQMDAVYEVIGAALEEGGAFDDDEDEDDDEYDEYDDDDDDDDDYEEDYDVKHNVFEGDGYGDTLVHADFGQIMEDYKRFGSLKAAVAENAESLGVTTDELVHADTYGVQALESLFPQAELLGPKAPEFIKRDMDWVPKVLRATHHTPFSRIKSQFANITEDEARAKGYLKGHMKKEEVFSLLKRTTDPQTVYKKQKIDRDDVIDITDFDVVAWIKGEMRMMLEEELARAILIGDGRLPSDEDHISEDHIRPIWKDADLFTIKATITMPPSATDDDRSKAFIRACIKSRKLYKGSGNPTMFTTEDLISDMLLLENGIGEMMYKSEAELATKCRVSGMVSVPLMEGVSDANQGSLAAIIVNMNDYNVGADKGGAVSLFDDFDIDYNQQKYLIETRCSGALTKPYSAIAISFKTGDQSVKNPVITFSGNGLADYAIKG